MFIAFEGIDGSGKTTLSNRLARSLRACGLDVEHVREGGNFASAVVQGIREFGRDARNLKLTPKAELMIYSAREAQLLEEVTRPALGQCDVVLADRYVYTAAILAEHGRGLPAEEVEPVVEAAAGGTWPDLVILVDSDPQIARARRRVSKVIAPAPKRPSSRKGLAGAGLQHRLRRGYLELAASDPGRWIVVENVEAELDEIAARLLSIARIAIREGAAAAIRESIRNGAKQRPLVRREITGPAVSDIADGLAHFLRWLDRCAAREPGLAAWFLAGLAGPEVDGRRKMLAASQPEIVASGLGGLDDDASWQLRAELAARAPRQVARTLPGMTAHPDLAWRFREMLVGTAPAEVAGSLGGLDDERAWEMRERLWAEAPDEVSGSLKRMDTERAWALRERWRSLRGGDAVFQDPLLSAAAVRSVSGVESERAWAIRNEAMASAPVAALSSLAAIDEERAWHWRERHISMASRVVLGTISGMDHPRGWALREAIATRCKEALDGIPGMDAPEAWRLRDRCADLWPSTVVKSLGTGRKENPGLVHTSRGERLLRRQLDRHGRNVSLLKHVAAIALSNRSEEATSADAGSSAVGGP